MLNLDSGARQRRSGAALCDQGLAVELTQNLDSALLKYRLVGE
ncbi:MAG: hypothetical protein WCP21_04760 [Armatimonadota bacterium]